MTINANIEVNDATFVNLHAALGAAVGTALVVQATSNYNHNVRLINSVLEPVSSDGGIETNERFAIINCNPDATESTWAITDEGINILRVQS